MRQQPDLPSALPTGLVAVTGDEGTGKTSLLRRLASQDTAPGLAALWLDLALPGRDEDTPGAVWAGLRASYPPWNQTVQDTLVEAFQLQPHLEKQLFMLSTGSRRKVALVGLLAAGAPVTCLDQPCSALDLASVKALRAFLQEQAGHGSRTWVVADYEADPQLPWQLVISLD